MNANNHVSSNFLLSRVVGATALTFVTVTAANAQVPIQPRMGDPVPGLSASELNRFDLGKQAFNKTQSIADGLGPVFNDTSCEHCHLSPTIGGSSTKFVTRFGKAASGSTPFDPLDPMGGSLLQKSSINTPLCDETIPPQADVVITRMTPPTFGFGLVEAIADSDIQVREAFPPPGVSGRAHLMTAAEAPLGPLRVGRFGFKAQVPTVLTFSGDAGVNELGLSNRLFTADNAPNGDPVRLAQCDTVADPEDHSDPQGFHQIDRMTDFQRYLAAPPQTPKSGMLGEVVFNGVGCGACHVSTSYTTLGSVEAGLANQEIKPYSDFLLHDVGSLGDGIPQGMATETEFRTTPLWGVGHRATFALLHDGRAAGQSAAGNIDLAILAHDGEALASRNAYVALSAADKTKLQNFLLSLGRAEFDAEFNNNVDEIDWFFLRTWVTGPGNFYTADSPEAIADFDQDGDFDLRDIAALQRAYTGT